MTTSTDTDLPRLVALTTTERAVLAALADRASGATVAELMQATHLSVRITRKHVALLLHLRYAHLSGAAAGRRAMVVSLTTQGRRALAQPAPAR